MAADLCDACGQRAAEVEAEKRAGYAQCCQDALLSIDPNHPYEFSFHSVGDEVHNLSVANGVYVLTLFDESNVREAIKVLKAKLPRRKLFSRSKTVV